MTYWTARRSTCRGTEDQVRYLLSLKGVDALLVAAVGMALVALAVAASAVGLHSSAQLAQRILAAIGFMGLSTLALWAGMALKGTRDEAGSRVPVPVPVRVRARVRPKR